MEIQEVDALRPLLFEALDYKAWQLYIATRSKQNTEEVRDYVITILALTAEYVGIHIHDFRLRKKNVMQRIPQHSRSPIYYMKWWTEVENFRSTICDDALKMEDIHSIRRWVWFVFDKILELHCYLEWLDYREEHNHRYTYIRGQAVLKQWIDRLLVQRKRSSKGWWLSMSTWEFWFWSLFKEWSWESIARKEYDCMNCSETIRPWDRYSREVMRMWRGLEVLRYHVNCPDDPNDPRWKDYEHEIEDQSLPDVDIKRKIA